MEPLSGVDGVGGISGSASGGPGGLGTHSSADPDARGGGNSIHWPEWALRWWALLLEVQYVADRGSLDDISFRRW